MAERFQLLANRFIIPKHKLDTVFKYFVLLMSLFVMLALLPRLKSFNVSKDGVQAEFNEYKEALNEAQNKSSSTTTA